MIRLTPLHETTSFREGFKEEHIKTLMPHFQAKYLLSTKQHEALQNDLQQLALDDVRALYVQSLHMDTFEQLRDWVFSRLPVQSA